jgi:lipoprotein-anchoring transpeptidase ErfK/SrfK
MRCLAIAALAAAIAATASAARADVAITVDKDNQQMTVAVDGQVRYRWSVSTGNPSYETPNGSHRAFRMEPDHFSKEFDDAPMPHSIFFTKKGHAIHGTFSEKSLGVPVSHGCVRLSRANAATLYKLVEEQGVLKTTVTLTGSSRVALARRGNQPKETAVARRDPAPDYDANGQPVGAPRQLVPSRQAYPQASAQSRDDGDDYFHSYDDGDAQRYPAPRSYRRNEARAYSPPAYDPYRGYAPRAYPPQVYAPSPYRGRGLFSSDW